MFLQVWDPLRKKIIYIRPIFNTFHLDSWRINKVLVELLYLLTCPHRRSRHLNLIPDPWEEEEMIKDSFKCLLLFIALVALNSSTANNVAPLHRSATLHVRKAWHICAKTLFSESESPDSRWSCRRVMVCVCYLGVAGDIYSVKGLMSC